MPNSCAAKKMSDLIRLVIAYLGIYIYIYIHKWTGTYMQTLTRASVHVYTLVYMHTHNMHIRTRMHAHTYIHTYLHTYIHTYFFFSRRKRRSCVAGRQKPASQGRILSDTQDSTPELSTPYLKRTRRLNC